MYITCVWVYPSISFMYIFIYAIYEKVAGSNHSIAFHFAYECLHYKLLHNPVFFHL